MPEYDEKDEREERQVNLCEGCHQPIPAGQQICSQCGGVGNKDTNAR